MGTDASGGGDSSRSSALAWSLHELGQADFNDKRLTRRGVQIAAALLEHPQCSIPRAVDGWAAAKATYRFLDNDKVTPDAMLEAHQEQLRERASACETVLVAQDTSTLNFSNRKVSGLGSIGDGGKDKDNGLKGLFVHSGLAMSAEGVPLGLTSQKVYARKDETKTENRYERERKPISEKETSRWVEAVSQARAVLPDSRIVVIGDRESDIYEVFWQGRIDGVDLLVRTAKDRLVDEIGQTKLFEKARTGQIVATYEAEIPVDHRKTRKATLSIRVSGFALQVPVRKPKAKRQAEGWGAIPLTILDVTEENPPAEVEPIHWLLTTSLTVATPEEAIEKVVWYTYRWRVERFHYTLKTGAFNVEKLQLNTFERFSKAIVMYSLVATRLIHTLYYERDHQDQPAESSGLFSDDELRALRFKSKKHGAAMTLHEAVVAIAKLGGYLARKADGPPGIKALWIGFWVLQNLVEGIELGRQMAAADELSS